MPKTGNNIYKRKDGRWEGRYRKGRGGGGKIIYGYVFAKTCGEVKERLSSMPKAQTEPADQTDSVAAVAERWLTITALRVKASTLSNYEAALKLHILPRFGQMKPENLTAALIGGVTSDKLTNGRADGRGGLSPKTARDILSVLKGVIDFAASEGLIKNAVKITYPKQKPAVLRALSRLEQTSVKKVLLSEITVFKTGVLLCLYTGLRAGDAYVKHKLKKYMLNFCER